MAENDDGISPIPRIYTLAEAAGILRVSVNWLRAQLGSRRFAGLKQGGRWAMTEAQILAVIESSTVPARVIEEEPNNPYGISNRSWTYRQRAQVPGTGVYNRRMGIKVPPQPHVDSYRVVQPAPAAAIAKMGKLSETQQALLDRVRREGEVSVGGPGVQRTVESLARRDLVTYHSVSEVHERWMYYARRFVVRCKG